MNITKEGKEQMKKQELYQDLETQATEMKKVDASIAIYDLVAMAETLIYENPNDQELGGKIRELFRKW